jgi:hypothetical protein
MLTKLSKRSSRRNLRFVATCILQLGHSLLHLLKLSFMHGPQNRWLQSGMICVSSIIERQIGHSRCVTIDCSSSIMTVGDIEVIVLDYEAYGILILTTCTCCSCDVPV